MIGNHIWLEAHALPEKPNRKDDYMRGYGDGFRGGMVEMLAALQDAESAIAASISYYGTDAALSALKSVRGAISKAVQP